MAAKVLIRCRESARMEPADTAFSPLYPRPGALGIFAGENRQTRISGHFGVMRRGK
jgi:hypothetical protein